MHMLYELSLLNLSILLDFPVYICSFAFSEVIKIHVSTLVINVYILNHMKSCVEGKTAE